MCSIEHALALVEKLRGVRYDWRASEFPAMHFDSDRHVTFVAPRA